MSLRDDGKYRLISWLDAPLDVLLYENIPRYHPGFNE